MPPPRPPGKLLRNETLVVLESTTYPGTTDEVVRPMLEKASGLTVGIDFHLAFSPERIDPGNEVFVVRNTPKVVGGLTATCTDAAADFYGRVCDSVVKAKSAREAEMAKLLENTYRHVNIALVNEMAIFCHELGVDLWMRSGAPQPSRSGSRRSILARVSAVIVSRSTLTTCRTRYGPNSAIRSDSLS